MNTNGNEDKIMDAVYVGGLSIIMLSKKYVVSTAELYRGKHFASKEA